MTGPAVDVVILTWNDGELLDAAVESALNSAGVDVRVIVVDNGSEPEARVVDDQRVTLVRNSANRGVAAGRNQGAAHGEAPFICFLDSDAKLWPATLERLLQPMVWSHGVALTAPVFTGQAPEASAGRAPTVKQKALRALNRRDTYRPAGAGGPWWDVDFAIGACQLVRRAEFEAAGGFDESYFYGPEDVDLCLRLWKAGHRVVQVADARCDHPPRRRFRGMFTTRGVQHGLAVTRHLWRHRHFRSRVA